MATRPLIVGVIVFGASAAIADTPPKEEQVPRVRLGSRVHRDAQPKRVGDWVEIATPTPTSHGTEFITIAAEVGTLRTLRIDVDTGRVELRKVVVEFAGGKHATFQLDKLLTSRHPTARIELEAARKVDSIAITTSRLPAGSYTVLGSASLAPVTEQVAMR